MNLSMNVARSRPTLEHVAREAGVSRGTVSNVFVHPERVRPEVRERVEAAATRLRYAGPDPRGRLLRAGKFNSLGFVIPGHWEHLSVLVPLCLGGILFFTCLKLPLHEVVGALTDRRQSPASRIKNLP